MVRMSLWEYFVFKERRERERAYAPECEKRDIGGKKGHRLGRESESERESVRRKKKLKKGSRTVDESSPCLGRWSLALSCPTDQSRHWPKLDMRRTRHVHVRSRYTWLFFVVAEHTWNKKKALLTLSLTLS